jgi:hypothetical protein
MKDLRSAATITVSILVIISLTATAGTAFGQTIFSAQPVLRQRAVPVKPLRAVLNAGTKSDVIVVKFREGTHVREGAGQLVSNPADISSSDDQLLFRANLFRQQIAPQLTQFNNLVSPNLNRYIERAFKRSVAELDAEKQTGEAASGAELADLNLYYNVLIPNSTPTNTARLIDQLNALDIVEIAYVQPVPEDPTADISPISPSFVGDQGYLGSAPAGIDANFARQFAGTQGNDVRIIDVERGWTLDHEDLPTVFHQSGVLLESSKQHGAAVLGVLAAGENAFGVTGIAPNSSIGVSSTNRVQCMGAVCITIADFPDAVSRATGQLRPGDVMLLEQHAPGPSSGLSSSSSCNPSQFEFVAMEFFQANFDAIRNATANGIIVVEAAGNGTMDLDSPIYSGLFNRSVRDSGAILVGAGTSNGRAPMCFTNFGSRVDVQGWGENVTTLGFGDCSGCKINGDGDHRQWYTKDFSGTSSASPIVAGAALSVQGYRKARGQSVFNSIQMRNLLRQTGTPQAADARQIGPLPNLRSALDAATTKRTLKITFLSIKVVDSLFPGPHALAFRFFANNAFGVFPAAGTASFPQSTSVNLPASFTFTQTEAFPGGMTILVQTELRPIIRTHPKTHRIEVFPRKIQMLRTLPLGTSYNSSSFTFFGSRTFTDRSSDSSGFFEVTYRIEEIQNWVIAF